MNVPPKTFWFAKATRAFITLACLSLAGLSFAAEQTQVRLVFDAEVARPGQTFIAAVHLQLRSGWHSYWRNGGESGSAPGIKWTLPTGVTAGEILWQIPEKDTEQGLTTYVYNREVVLLVPLAIASDAAPGERELKADIKWLECKSSCELKQGALVAKFMIGAEGKRSSDANWVASWQQRLPRVAESGEVRASWDGVPGKDGTRKLVIESAAPAGSRRAEFFPDKSDDYEVKAATESSVANGRLRVRKPVEKSKEAGWPAELRGLFVSYDSSGKPVQALEAKVAITTQRGASNSSGDSETPAAGSSSQATVSVPGMLFFAFIGGLILNIMPCVLPVIALKVLGFVRQSGESPARVRKLGLIYALGVFCSFTVLAGLVISVQLVGRQASWGMQFGNPIFVVAMATLVTLIALNLFGVFEVTLGGGAMTAASKMASKEGGTGAFFNGVFATALATPCTAPYLGAALGWAFAQPPLMILLTFLIMASGLALPYVLLTSFPALMRFLPKPGAWMEHFKVAMGFPMLGTAVWLFTLSIDHYGDRVLWLGFFLMLVALAAWVFGQFYQRSTEHRAGGFVIALSLVVVGYAFVLEGPLHWRSSRPAEGGRSLAMESGGIPWKAWSTAAVEASRKEGRVALVDFTARWCATCQLNKRTSIEIPSVREKLKELDAVVLLGDYSRVPDDMTEELRRFGRAGVPLVLVYPKDATRPPKVLPEVLTPGIMLEALAEAAR